MNPPNIAYLSDISFEPGALSILPNLLSRFSILKPLVVTDPGLTSMGIVERLEIGKPAVFDQIESNPTEANAILGLEAFRNHGCDGIVAVGGGSPIDCAKCIGLLVHHPQPLSDYAFINAGLSKITGKNPPLLAIPTTAGTGSEVGRAALVSMNNGRKLAIISPHMIPNAVICDPKLTLGLPKELTAGTGMDAVAHCVETYCSPRYNPVADAIALDGLARARTNIIEAVNHGSNLTVRTEMMMAALEGGLTFQKGLGLVHSLSHPLGGLRGKRVHHGTLNAIFLPHVLRFNMETCPEKMARIASAVGASKPSHLPGFFERLSSQIGLPGRLRDLGLVREDIEPMPDFALEDHCSLTNPRPVTRAVCTQLYEDAW
ncbi:MAG: iron-containing alcohol dehydrogenase [Acidobacteriia bacterium]|nr:iron-containing alcohol dehydrogenase [Terriglobia bacterium]